MLFCSISLRIASFYCAWFAFAVAAISAAEPPITAIAFSPDGRSVVVGSQAGLTVRTWHDLAQARSIETRVVNVHDLAFSPHGKLLAVAGGTPAHGGRVEIVAWPSGEVLKTLRGHEDSVWSVAWMGDLSLATASLDHEIAVWDVGTEKPLRRLKGHSRGVTTLCYLPEQQTLVSGSLDQNLRVWNIESAEIVRTLNNHTQEVHQVAARPATKVLPMIASASGDRTLRLWQPTIGRMVRFAQLDSAPLAVAWLPNGSHVAVATEGGRVLLIDPDTVETIEDLPAVAGWAYSLAAHPNDGSFLVGGRNGQLVRTAPKSRPGK